MSMKTIRATAAPSLPVLCGAVAGMWAAAKVAPQEPVWTEIAWPFAIDQWGAGRAFVCMPDRCGVRVDLFVRPKIGFCNCATGVSDDAELERVSDTDLLGRTPQPRAGGRPIKVAWMNGLSRPYSAS